MGRSPTSTSCWRNASAPRRPSERGRATAIVAAAGLGERLGERVPKALVEVRGRSLLGWCLEAVDAAELVGDVVVAVPAGFELGIEGEARFVVGGRSRAESVALALEHVDSEQVVVHDAARPLAGSALFDAVLESLSQEGADAVLAAIPATDTVKQVGEGAAVVRTLDRSVLWSAQTPQAFRTAALRAAIASKDDLASATDEASLVEEAGGLVLVHEASPENIKVTTPRDLRLAELLLAAR